MRTVILLLSFFLLFLSESALAQNCLDCSSAFAVNNGLIFCTTMTGNASDGSMSPLTPTINGLVNITTDRFNTDSSAYDFTNTATTRISYGPSTKLNVPSTQSFTMSAWFFQRDTSSTSGSFITGLTASNNSGFLLFIGGSAQGSMSRKIIFHEYYAPTTSSRVVLADTNNIQLNTWYNATITINKSTGSYILYLNGVEVAHGVNTNYTVISSPSFHIGNNAVNAWGINGKVDDVKIYNRALSATEVYQLYASQTPVITPMVSQTVCETDSVQLDAFWTEGQDYLWSPSSTIARPDSSFTKAKPTVDTKYYVTVSRGACSTIDSVYIMAVHPSSTVTTGVDNSVCLGDSLQLNATGATSYSWLPAAGINNPTIPNPIVTPTKTTDYIVKGVNGVCTSYDTIRVSVCVCSFFDTITVVAHDTLYSTIFDTTFVTAYDTINTTLFDTITVTAYDTLIYIINDTAIVTIHDTLFHSINDTVIVNIMVFDTITVTLTDTIYHTVYDTIRIAVTDTLIINIRTGLNPPNHILNTLKIYPNPASDLLFIDNGNFSQMSNYTVRINNLLGQTVFSAGISQPSFSIPVTTLGGSGTYFVQILNGSNQIIETRKVVVR